MAEKTPGFKVLSEEEARRIERTTRSELLELKKQLVEAIEEEKEKLRRYIEHLRKVKEERDRLKEELEKERERVRKLEEELREGGALKDVVEELREENEELKAELERLNVLLTAKDEEIRLTKEILERTTSYKEELEKRLEDMARELQMITRTVLSGTVPVESEPRMEQSVEFERPAKVEATVRPKEAPAEAPKRRLLTGFRGEGSLLRPSVTLKEMPPKKEKPAQEPFSPAESQEKGMAICPVCDGEGVVGVRKKDGTIVKMECPNCGGKGRV